VSRLRPLCFVVLILVFAAGAWADSVPGVMVYHAPIYTTYGDDPSAYVVGPGDSLDGVFFDGVVDVIGFDTGVGGYIRGSGALLSGPNGEFVLTAAHVADGLDVSDTRAYFGSLNTPERTKVDVSAAFIHPDWDGQYLIGNDLALLKLAESAPEDAQRYDIYRGDAEVGAVGVKAGYGQSGSGTTGTDVPPFFSGTKRAGKNKYDALGDIFGDVFDDNFGLRPLDGAQLAYDFDDGTADHDAFGMFYSLADLGVGFYEVCAAPGDSGGPTFIDGQVAGVTSYSLRMAYAATLDTSDVDDVLNSSFGEFVVDTRVSHYAGWVDSVVIPEPVTAGGLLLGLAVLVRYLRSR